MNLLETLEQAALQFRLGQEGGANDNLVELLDGIMALLPKLASQDQARLVAPFQEVLAAQQRGDTLWIADLLVYEVAPLLRSMQT